MAVYHGRSARLASSIVCVFFLSAILCFAMIFPLSVPCVEANPGIGYWIIVEGHFWQENGIQQEAIRYGCNQVYEILKGVGYSSDRIRYLKEATSATFEQAIMWAKERVSSSEPLWMYMFGHGSDQSGGIFVFYGPSWLTYSEIDGLLDANIPSASIYMIIATCYSGMAIDDLNDTGRLVITSCNETQISVNYNATDVQVPQWEAFSKPFWDKIKEFQNVRDSFNNACWNIHNVQIWNCTPPDQDPLLDDDGNGNGHTGYPDPLPNGGDGDIAVNLHIGSHEYQPIQGGYRIPVDKVGLLTPYIGYACIVVVSTVIAALRHRHIRHREKEQ